ncbi:MAG: hypothetical protein LBQ08_02680 [Holosporaceae bacterium]|nr:hypothetical protein [Holosporaceae bacterium]
MRKQLGAIFLLAGTAIGSGMISLPIVLVNFGIIGSLLLMLFFCWVTYVSAMIRCELNIHSQADFSLKDVGLFFGEPISANIGDACIKILSFALLSAYIFGGTSVIRSSILNGYSFTNIAIIFAVAISLIFLFSTNLIIKINNHAFIILFSIILVGIVCLTMCSRTDKLPTHMGDIWHLKAWTTVLPVVFTSFGFQASLHSLTKFVDNDKKVIQRACLFGSIIPVIMYSLWVTCVLTIIFNSDPESFHRMLISPLEVGELIRVLSVITNITVIQHAAWVVSFLAIITSIIGVGLSLNEILEKDLKHFASNVKFIRIISTLFMIVPATTVAIFVPNAFIRVLNFAGIILAIIAIILPVFLFMRMSKVHSIIDKGKALLILMVGIAIIIFGILDIFGA